VKFTKLLTTNRVVLGCLCAGTLAVAACADGPGGLTAPSAVNAESGLAATGSDHVASAATVSFPRSGDLHVTKDCSEDTGLPGAFCTITRSNLAAIEVGSKIIYHQASGATSQDSDITIEPPGPGNNRAYGHCTVEFVPVSGQCTISGGTGRFTFLRASVAVSALGGFDYGWHGTYSFSPRD